MVAVHCGVRTVVQKKLGLATGRHLRAMRAPVAPECLGAADLRRAWCCWLLWHRRKRWCGWYGLQRRLWCGIHGSDSGRCRVSRHLLFVVPIAIRSQCQQQHQADDLGKSICGTRTAGWCNGRPTARVSKGLSDDVNGLRPAVLATAHCIRQPLALGWPGAVARQFTDVQKHIRSAACRGNETKAAVVIPCLERAGESHGKECLFTCGLAMQGELSGPRGHVVSMTA